MRREGEGEGGEDGHGRGRGAQGWKFKCTILCTSALHRTTSIVTNRSGTAIITHLHSNIISAAGYTRK